MVDRAAVVERRKTRGRRRYDEDRENQIGEITARLKHHLAEIQRQVALANRLVVQYESLIARQEPEQT